MTPAGGDSDLEQALQMAVLEARRYVDDDRNWQQPQPARPAASRWPASTTLWWRFYSTAWECAFHHGLYTRGIPQEETDPRRELLDSVARAAAEHALQACRKHFGTGYLAGARAESNRAKARAVGQALRDGAPSLGAAFDAAGVSRSAGKRILKRK